MIFAIGSGRSRDGTIRVAAPGSARPLARYTFRYPDSPEGLRALREEAAAVQDDLDARLGRGAVEVTPIP